MADIGKIGDAEALTYPPPPERATGFATPLDMETIASARLAGFHAARDWMKQGVDYVEGWRDGAAAAFEFLGIPKDERYKILLDTKRPPYSWEERKPE